MLASVNEASSIELWGSSKYCPFICPRTAVGTCILLLAAAPVTFHIGVVNIMSVGPTGWNAAVRLRKGPKVARLARRPNLQLGTYCGIASASFSQ